MPNPQSFKPNMGVKNNIRFTTGMLLDFGRVAFEGCKVYFELWFEVKIQAQEAATKIRKSPLHVEDNHSILSIILASTNSYDNVMARPRVQ